MIHITKKHFVDPTNAPSTSRYFWDLEDLVLKVTVDHSIVPGKAIKAVYTKDGEAVILRLNVIACTLVKNRWELTCETDGVARGWFTHLWHNWF